MGAKCTWFGSHRIPMRFAAGVRQYVRQYVRQFARAVNRSARFAEVGGVTTRGFKRYVTVAEAADRLGISPSSVYRAIDSGHLPAVQLRRAGALRIPRDAIEARSQRHE